MSKARLYVVAATYAAYRAWCDSKGLKSTAGFARYVRSATDLNGLSYEANFVCIEGWTDRHDWRDIHARLEKFTALREAAKEDHGTIRLESFPTCPECGAVWTRDNRHIDDGHCPGRPEGCTCKCDMQYHRPPSGVHEADTPGARWFCPCRYVHVKAGEQP